MSMEYGPTVKVRVAVTIEVDRSAYLAEYGDPTESVAEMRDYVKGTAVSAVVTALERLDYVRSIG